MLISIIIPCKNEGQNLQMTLSSLFNVRTKQNFEVVVVDDGSTDNNFEQISIQYPQVKLYREEKLGAAGARNFGAAKASGDIYVFCDAHLKFYNYWLDKLAQTLLDNKFDAISPGIGVLKNPEQAGFGLTWDENLKTLWLGKPSKYKMVPLLPGGCLMIKNEVFWDVEGFDKGFLVWGHEDEEISLKLWLFGYKCCIYPEVLVLHKFRSKHPYTVTFEHVYYNFLRMALSHFNHDRIAKVKKIIDEKYNCESIYEKLMQSDILRQRETYLKRRKFNDDWYFNKFKITF